MNKHLEKDENRFSSHFTDNIRINSVFTKILKRYVQITIKQNSISLKRERFMRMVNFEDVTPTLKKKDLDFWKAGGQNM